MKKLHEFLLNTLSRIDDDIIERNSLLRWQLQMKLANGATAKPKGRSLRLIAIAACLALLLATTAIVLPMMLSNEPEPVLPGVDSSTDSGTAPGPDSSAILIEKISDDGSLSIYTVTYPNGQKATFSVTNHTASGISNLEVAQNGEFSLRMASGNILQIGSSVGLMENGNLSPTEITGATVSTDGSLSLTLANKNNLQLGTIEHEGELLLSAARINGAGELTLLLPSGDSINLGRVVGEKGEDGKDGVGIAGIAVNNAGELTVTLTDGTVLNLGKIKGEDGIGISESKINDKGELCLTYTDGKEVNLGRVVGEKGEDGVGIASITLVNGSDLTITLTDGTVISLGNIKGADGKSAYELYREIYGYEGTEEEWLFDLVNGGLAIKQKFTVTFDTEDGSEVEPQEVTYGGKATEPAPPTRFGYIFLGWYYDEEKWSFNGYSVTENMTLTAKWKPNILSTQSFFDLQGGDFSFLNHELVFNEETNKNVYVPIFGSPETGIEVGIPVKAGHQFVGWTWEGQDTPILGTITVFSNEQNVYSLNRLQFSGDNAPTQLTANWKPIAWELLPVNGAAIDDDKADGNFAIRAEYGTAVFCHVDGTVKMVDRNYNFISVVTDYGTYIQFMNIEATEKITQGMRVSQGMLLGTIAEYSPLSWNPEALRAEPGLSLRLGSIKDDGLLTWNGYYAKNCFSKELHQILYPSS